MKYGAQPAWLGVHDGTCVEFMFYQYLPVKLAGQTAVAREDRLKPFDALLGAICCDYVGFRGLTEFVSSYVYMTAKRMYQAPGCPMNRPGWHTDGFGTDDINYIWSDHTPTIFNYSNFDLPTDDYLSMLAMSRQADPSNNNTFADGSLLRLDQFVVHRVADVQNTKPRTFLKVSFSRDKYDLAGNAHNPLLDYEWPMRERTFSRNVPQVHRS